MQIYRSFTRKKSSTILQYFRLNSVLSEASGGLKRVGNHLLTQKDSDFYRGKLRRLCEPKRDSGKIEVPEDIHKQFMQKGSQRDALFEALVNAKGDKDMLAEKFSFIQATTYVHINTHTIYTYIRLFCNYWAPRVASPFLPLPKALPLPAQLTNLSCIKKPWHTSFALLSQEEFLRKVTLTKSTENTRELEEEGGYYTPEEMVTMLKWSKCFGLKWYRGVF